MIATSRGFRAGVAPRAHRPDNRQASRYYYLEEFGVEKKYQVIKYFGDSGALAQKASRDIRYYAWDNTQWNIIPKPDTRKLCAFSDQYNNDRIAYYKDKKGSCRWLRSPGYYSLNAARVSADGSVDVRGSIVNNNSDGVRPALWLNL